MLKTRNVLLDTQAFLQYKFRFDHPALKRLLDLCKSRMLQLILTEPIVGEVRAKLTEQLADAAKSLNQFHKLAGAIENNLPDQYKGLLAKPTESEVIELGVKAWEGYLANSKAIIVPASVVNGTDLLELYFGAKPPFADGRKKNEFPDAISVLSIAAWMKTNQTKVYVVSQDSDLASWCEETPGAIHIKSLAEFIDLYNRAEEKLTELAHEIFIKKQSTFLEAITSQFLSSGFVYSDNWEADVVDVEVNNIDVVEVNIIEVDETRALVSVSVQIEFSAAISGPDYDNGYWDSEDKKYAYLPDFNIEHTFTEQYEASVEFELAPELEDAGEILSVVIDDGSDITLSIDDGYPYK